MHRDRTIVPGTWPSAGDTADSWPPFEVPDCIPPRRVPANPPTSVWLRGHRVVLVDETAQHVVTTDTERSGSGGDPAAGHRHFKIDASVRALLVVVVLA